MHWIDQKYVNLLSTRLPGFKKVNNDTYNVRCIICGDSKKHKTRARGYFLSDNKGTRYYCHNCHTSLTLKNFLSQLDPLLANQYVQESYVDRQSNSMFAKTPLKAPDVTVIETPRYLDDLKGLKKVSQLPPAHKAKKYIEQRKIPPSTHYKIFYAPHFSKWVNTIVPGKLNEENDEGRIVLPFLSRDKKLLGFTGRSIDNNPLRYITIMLDNQGPKLFGLDSVNFNKKIYITEGPIDSLFLDNALAMAGSDMHKAFKMLQLEPRQCVMIFDNEPRNKEIVAKMAKCIEQGFNIFIWPERVSSKDLNDLVMEGMSLEKLKSMVDRHTSFGMEAQLKLNVWKKV